MFKIQHVVGADGVRSTTVTTSDGTTMILGEASTADEENGTLSFSFL